MWTTCPRLLRSIAPGKNRTHVLMIALRSTAKPLLQYLDRYGQNKVALFMEHSVYLNSITVWLLHVK